MQAQLLTNYFVGYFDSAGTFWSRADCTDLISAKEKVRELSQTEKEKLVVIEEVVSKKYNQITEL